MLGSSQVRNDKIGLRRKRCIGRNRRSFLRRKTVGGAAPRKTDSGIARFLAIPAPEVLEPVVLNAIITPEFSTARGEQST